MRTLPSGYPLLLPEADHIDVNLTLDAIKASHKQGCKSEVGVASRVRESDFDAARLRVGYVRNSY